ncbi:unnamed protein product [Rotaria sp. Silwood1]|nr:unnamed protein product [Rotaria sp. Silwood1]CAF4928407.1 unnamed protein product [Rotaria sp. Silwood1]CAF4931944.1 unnamed protein product [Rotaria sp. Silwood1]
MLVLFTQEPILFDILIRENIAYGDNSRINIPSDEIIQKLIVKVCAFFLATSALDSENEKIVQEALDRAQENRISVTIAHRLSTILNSDLICVIHNGRIVEYGTHKELIVLNGHYYRLA